MTKASVTLVKLNKKNISELLQLESDNSTWNQQAFEQEFAITDSSIFGLTTDGKLVAYMIVRQILDELHIVNILVKPAERHKGWAKQLFSYVLNECKLAGIKSAWLEVRSSNSAALALYKKFGFVQYSSRSKYYTDNQEDALLLKLQLE